MTHPVTTPQRRRRLGRVLMWWLPIIAIAGAGSQFVPAAKAGPAPAAAATGPVDAAAIYGQNCASCHGADGTGTSRAPSLQGVGTAAVDFELTTGRMPKHTDTRKPPPYRPSFSPRAITALDRYVTALAAHGGPPIPAVDPQAGSVAQGGTVFREYCAACHGWGGGGGELTDRPLPSPVEATPTQVAEAVRVGPAEMPKFGTDALSPQELNSVAAYVEQLKHPDNKGGNPLSHLGPAAEGAIAWLLGMVALIGVISWIGKRG